MRLIAVTATVAIALASPAAAGAKFAVYEGKDAVQEGRGGARLTWDGIDFWTTGDPPRRYEVLGVLTDTRGGGILSGDAIGAPSIIKKVKALGGSGVIVLDRSSRQTGTIYNNRANGTYGDGRVNAFGTGIAVPITRNTTQMLVVRYLEDDSGP